MPASPPPASSMDPELDLGRLRLTPGVEGEAGGGRSEKHEVSEIEEGEEDLDVDEEDDDEEEGELEGVILGFAENPKDPRSLLRHSFPSKAGGVPAWLDPLDLPPEGYRICGFCGDPLQFLLQVYAPIPGEVSAFHRTLFVFMCPSMSCLLKDQHEQWKARTEKPRRSVKVFRCQLAQNNPFYSSASRDGADKPFSSVVALCSWCGTWKGDKVCSSCRRANYCSEKHQVAHWKAGHKTECRRAIFSPTSTSARSVSCKSLWPEYEITNEDEPACDDKVSDNNSNQASLVPTKCKSDETFDSLMDKFDANDDKRSWASFQERIGRAPQQVLRYHRDPNAKPLWPTSTGCLSRPDVPNCSSCNGPSMFEFQVMPQLLYYFGVRNEPGSLDWATIVIYTCASSCCGPSPAAAYKEEYPWVQLYPPETST